MADTIIDGTQLNVNNIMYTAPKATAQGAKSINILNKSTKSGLRISTPLMLTWGASDFVDDKGVSNGRYDMALQFPGEEYKTEDTTAFLENMIALENKIQADALFVEEAQYNTNNVNLNALINTKLNSSDLANYYSQTQTNSNFYNKSYIDTSLTNINSNIALKVNTSDLANYYNKTS